MYNWLPFSSYKPGAGLYSSSPVIGLVHITLSDISNSTLLIFPLSIVIKPLVGLSPFTSTLSVLLTFPVFGQLPSLSNSILHISPFMSIGYSLSSRPPW